MEYSIREEKRKKTIVACYTLSTEPYIYKPITGTAARVWEGIQAIRATYRLMGRPKSSWKRSLFRSSPNTWIPTFYFEFFCNFLICQKLNGFPPVKGRGGKFKFLSCLDCDGNRQHWQRVQLKNQNQNLKQFWVFCTTNTIRGDTIFLSVRQQQGEERRRCSRCDRDDVERPKLDDQSRPDEPFKRTHVLLRKE